MLKRCSLIFFMLGQLIFISGCGLLGSSGPYVETFDSTGSWGVGDEGEIKGAVNAGSYDFLVDADVGIFWATANENFGDGTYEVEATAIEGPIDNGFGMMFMTDIDNDNFYLFEISSDGFVWISRCIGACQEDLQFIVDSRWFESSAVKTGLNETNRLKAIVDSGEMVFFVNDQEVGRGFDDTFSSGDIGIMVETIGEGGVRVRFDNFKFTPKN